MNFGQKLLLTAAALLVPVLSHAEIITGNPSLAAGGLSFSNFSCSTSISESMPALSNCGSIDVSSLTGSDAGVHFSGGMGSNFFSSESVLIGYDVNSLNSIYSMGLLADGSFSGNANASVITSVYDSSNALVREASQTCDSTGCSGDRILSLNGFYNDLHVIQSVTMNGQFGLAVMSPIDNTFTAAPEPSTNALLAAGLAAGALLLRRRNAKKAQA